MNVCYISVFSIPARASSTIKYDDGTSGESKSTFSKAAFVCPMLTTNYFDVCEVFNYIYTFIR